MANVGPTAWYCRDNAPTSTIGWSAVTAWATGATIAAGARRRQSATPTTGNERVFVAIVAGTTHATTEPTWVVTKGAKTTDNTVTWQECTGQPGVNGNTTDSPTWLQNKNTAVTLGLIIYDSGTASLQIVSTAGTTGNGSAPSFSATAGVTTADNTVTWTSLGLASGFGTWAAPFARFQTFVGTGWAAAGNTLFVGDDHVETQSTAMTVNSTIGGIGTPLNVLSIDHAGTLTLSGATLKSGASVATTGASALSVGNSGSIGAWFIYGVTFSAGSGAVNSSLSFAAGQIKLDTCKLVKAGTTGSGSAMSFGSTSNSFRIILNNTTVQFGAAGDGMTVTNVLEWSNTASAIAGATIPTTLITSANNDVGAFLDGIDLSAMTTQTIFGNGGQGILSGKNLKIASGTVISATPGVPGLKTDATTCDSAGTNYQKYRGRYQGVQTTEIVVIRTGGASNGTTAISDKIVTSANAIWVIPFESIPIAIWNLTTGSNRVVTLYGIWNAAALPNNDDIWINVEYFGSASSPQASFANSTKANVLATGSALTADSTSAWDSLATARANTHAYSLGDVIKVATNTGRIFFCTTAGTSAGSEPGGFATAVDGGSVTDSGAVFRAAVRFSMAITLSSPQPAMAGPIYVTVNAAKVSSTFYVDPLINLS